MTPKQQRPLELWAGVECTVNRVGGEFLDQLELNGHGSREGDMARLASLGAKRVRFPVIWERVAPGTDEARDWRWSDSRLQEARDLGLAPIVGLVHHGSGPRHTNLLDPQFPELLARYAREVAGRYPWVDAYTPVNEPMTTARFSGLYGHWYPHGTTDREWLGTLITELRGTVLAMRAVREINPGAQLIQTEDMGFTHSTEPLSYQAEFDNTRRWLGFDLLCGRVDEQHWLWGYLRRVWGNERDLLWFAENPCPPDIIGLNAYLTSERFLDHRLERYPQHTHGGNGRDAYADVEGVRVLGPGIGGFLARLTETHERYGLPIAITEAHLGCTREEQMRWLYEAWQSAEQARERGVDVRAVTPWSAFGAFDWNSLLTRWTHHYEPGLWDIRAPEPRPTALVRLARQLASGQAPDEPVLDQPGWWQREERLQYPPVGPVNVQPTRGRPLLITGASGTLGRAFARLCALRGLPYRLVSRSEMDIADPQSARAALQQHQPWAVINTAGYVRVDDAEGDERNLRENTEGPATLAAACAEAGVPLLTFSSDLVFDGHKGAPYVEGDQPNPLNAYGRSKWLAEQAVLRAQPDSLVVRTAAFFGPWDEYNFVTQAIAAARRGQVWRAAQDQVVSPTYVPDLVDHSLDLLIDGERGLWHLANPSPVSWADFARLAVDAAGLDAGLIEGVPGEQLGQRAPRPTYSALASERGWIMPTLANALERYLEAVRRMEQERPGSAAAD